MPYIKPVERKFIDKGMQPSTPGDLTFVLYRECQRYLGRLKRPPRFQDFAEVLGALEAAKMEIYRRKIAPYEDVKLAENGDVE